MAEHVCPWWVGYLLASPLRRFAQNPEKILGPYVKPGMTVVDIGCGMGFFSLPLARLVGSDGQVVCVDLQKKMIDSLRRRAKRAGLTKQIDFRVCKKFSLGVEDLAGKINFVLAFAVAHEIPDTPGFMAQIHAMSASDGKCLLAEPAGHVKTKDFEKTVAAAQQAGLTIVERPEIRRSRAVLLERA